MTLFDTVHDLRQGAELLRRRPYGLIVMDTGRLAAIYLRPWPKLIVGLDLPFPHRMARPGPEGDRCWLYYNQPCRHRRFLTLKYVVSSHHASFGTFRNALVVLDEIARLKASDAIVCEVRNARISDRLLRRWGWQSHVPSSRRRHFIKRFYGTYPDPGPAWDLARTGQQTEPACREPDRGCHP